MTSTQIICP